MRWKKQEIPLATHLEVKANKTTQKKAVKQAKDASKQLNQLLEENHFTLYLAVAAGAKLKQKEA